MKRLSLLLAGALGLAAAYAWGAATVAKRVFPYELVLSVADSLGLRPDDRRRARPRADRNAQLLTSLGYVHASAEADPARNGVTLHDRDRAYPGVNLYNEYQGETVRLIDMDGEVLHEWTYRHPADEMHHAELLPNGDLILTQRDQEVVRLNKDSEVLWRYEMAAHHDVWVNPDGSVWVIGREPQILEEISAERRIFDDYLVRLSPDGEALEKFSITRVLLDSPYRFLLASDPPDVPADAGLDVLHVNHVEEFDGSLAHVSPLFRKGNLLLSPKNISTILILDGETHEILWIWGPSNIGFQHHPRLLETGRILVFDNGLSHSRVLEISVPGAEIEWLYRADDFFSHWGGANQRLPNGNTLITESDPGRVLEVTPEGEKVWEFVNPHVLPSGLRVNIWRMKRFDRAALSFLD